MTVTTVAGVTARRRRARAAPAAVAPRRRTSCSRRASCGSSSSSSRRRPDVPDVRLDRLARQRLQADLLAERLRDGAHEVRQAVRPTRCCTAGSRRILTFLIGFPVAYTIAFRGGRYKNFLLFLVIAPFFTSFLIRTISWKILLGDDGTRPRSAQGPAHPAGRRSSLLYTPIAVDRRHHLQLPAVHGPAPLRRPREDRPRASSRRPRTCTPARWGAFRRVTFPLALPGVFAGTILTFIPALGDWVNAELLGNTQTTMIGNVIQDRFISAGRLPDRGGAVVHPDGRDPRRGRRSTPGSWAPSS